MGSHVYGRDGAGSTGRHRISREEKPMREHAPAASRHVHVALPFAYAAAERDRVRVQLLRILLDETLPLEHTRHAAPADRVGGVAIPLFGARWLRGTDVADAKAHPVLDALAAELGALAAAGRHRGHTLEQIVGDVRRLVSAVAGDARHDAHYEAVQHHAVQLVMAGYWKAAPPG
jgi:hypothetical protein